MSDAQRGLFEAMGDGLRLRTRSGRRRAASWLRRLAPAAVLLRSTVGLSYFIAAEVAVPPQWSSSAAYLIVAAALSLTAALAPAGIAPLAASATVIAAWLITSSVYEDHGGLWIPAAAAVLLYAGHSAAAVAQRFRTTTTVDSEIVHTWARHLGIVAASTVAFAGLLALFTAYFAAISPAVAVGVGLVAAVTVIYVLARSLHKRSPR
ncbi:hypothetical protein [Glycomyces arizonensis]|uniref:hypothetical protein n=1 Tax=Glycomyces arizonensis TaxID=256035 RepID=UPI000411094E|nr:hypothetical protein [Glycomyces arizonensis]